MSFDARAARFEARVTAAGDRAVARVVVKQASAKARDEAELYLLIADEIKDPVERKNFVRKAVSISGRR